MRYAGWYIEPALGHKAKCGAASGGAIHQTGHHSAFSLLSFSFHARVNIEYFIHSTI
jgi:hypothetical protein